MIENINYEQEIQSVDQTVAKQGSKYWDEIGIRCRWELHSLPEYIDGDELLSMGVMEKMMAISNVECLGDFTASLVEGYSTESGGKEHYRFSVIFGDGSDNKKFSYLREYTATTEHGEITGMVQSTVGLSVESEDKHFDISKRIADVYVEDMEAMYTDWKNCWSEGHFVIAR